MTQLPISQRRWLVFYATLPIGTGGIRHRVVHVRPSVCLWHYEFVFSPMSPERMEIFPWNWSQVIISRWHCWRWEGRSAQRWLYKSRERDGSWTAEGIWTKSCTNISYNFEPRTGEVFKVKSSKVKVVDTFLSGGIAIDGSPPWTFI